MGPCINPAWEELECLCVLQTPLCSRAPSCILTSETSTPSYLLLTAQANKINCQNFSPQSWWSLASLVLHKLSFFFFSHFQVISLHLPSPLSLLGGSASSLGPTLCLPLPATPRPSHSLFLPHCSLEMSKPAKRPLPRLPSLFLFPSSSSPSLLLALLAPEFYLLGNSGETPSLIISFVWRTWVQRLDLWYCRGVHFHSSCFITDLILILTLKGENDFVRALQ